MKAIKKIKKSEVEVSVPQDLDTTSIKVCVDCNGRGLKDANNLCTTCAGSGQI